MRCPACAAENSQGPQCRRCRADLALLFALEDRRRQTLAAARRHAAAGDGPAALGLAAEAHRLRRDAESWQALAVAHLLCRDFSAARRCALAARA
jgi:hypothetical protein